MYMGDFMSIIWGLIIILLLLLELVTVNVMTIWYAFSASISLVLTFTNNDISSNFTIQLFICLFIGTLLLVFLRKKAINFLKEKSVIISVDKLVGEQAVVTKRITKTKYGEIKVRRRTWTAYGDKKIDVGQVVEILEADGVKFKVKLKGN